jgi:hypothetical protein
MRYYWKVATEAWTATLRFAKRRGIFVGLVVASLGAITTSLITGELNWQTVASAAAGPVLAFLLVFVWKAVQMPPRLAEGKEAEMEGLRGQIARLANEKRAMEEELTPAISFETDNTPEYDRELEVEVFDRSTHERRQERQRVKLLKVLNQSAQSLVVNASIVEADPPITQDAGPPILLAWREGGRGNQTLPAHGFDYVVVSPPIPDVELWERPYARIIEVSAWVSGRLGATARYRLDNLRVPSQHPWITRLPD